MMPRFSRALIRLNTLLPRDELSVALEASSDPKERQLGNMLGSSDDRLANITIAGLATRLGVSHRQILTAYREYKRLEAIVEVAKQAPAIVRDIASDAQNREVTCESCEGSGRIIIATDPAEPITTKMCLPCEGTGKVIRHGDPVARKQALEIMDLAGRAPMMIDARGGNVIATTEGSLEETLKRMRSTNGRGNGASTDAAPVPVGEETLDVEGTVGGTASLDGSDSLEDASGATGGQ